MMFKHKTFGSGSFIGREYHEATLDHDVRSEQLYGPHVNIAARKFA
jgi:hypothetical protein